MNNCNFKKTHIDEIIKNWLQKQNTTNLFAYYLDVKESKYLKGSFNIYTQLNPDRMKLRRKPETISSLKPKFRVDKFNFRKICFEEIVEQILYESSDMTIIINQSPLTKYHSLICPDMHKNLPQYMTKKALQFSIEWIRFIAVFGEYQHFRIGYNSPGALASVNHLHLHLLYMEKDLYIDQAKLKPLKDNYIFCLNNEMPTEAICWLFRNTDTSEMLSKKVDEVYKFLEWLCDQNLPHNLFLTSHGLRQNDSVHLKLFIFVRDKFSKTKDLNTFNIGFCELSGYITVGDKALYDNLTEKDVFDKIKDTTGRAFERVYKYFI